MSPLRRFGQVPSYSPHRLVSQSATRFRKDLYKAVHRGTKHETYIPFDDHWVISSASNAFNYFGARRDEIRFAFHPP